MGRSRTAPLLVTGAALIGALLVVVIPGVTARCGSCDSVASPDSRAHLPGSTALRTPAPAYSPVPTTTAARGPAYPASHLGTGLLPADWGPPRSIEPPETPQARGPAYALPVPLRDDGWGPPKSTGPPSPSPEGGWSAAAAIPGAIGARPGTAQPGAAQPGAAQPGAAQPGAAQPGQAQPGQAQPGAARPGAGAGQADAAQAGAGQAAPALTAAPLGRPRQAAVPFAPFADPDGGDPGSDGYLVVGAVLLLAGGGLIVLARGIEAARPRRRRGAHRHTA